MKNAVIFVIGLIVGFIVTSSCKADDVYGVVTLHSYHFDRSAGYNETNWGVGLEYHPTEQGKDTGLRFGVGEYKNSFNITSVYGELAYLPWAITDGIRVGATVLAVTGYGFKPFVVVPLPVIEISNGYAGINLVVAPITKGGVALQFKFKF